MPHQDHPVTKDFFIAHFDLINFAPFYRNNPSVFVFETLLEFSKICRAEIERAGGKIVKFSSDSGLAVFEAEDIDKGVITMMGLKNIVDKWAKERVPGSRLAMNAHCGSATLGRLSGGEYELVGEAVSIVYTMGKREFLISPQAFRKLKAETRTSFKKFTPPIVYKLATSVACNRAF